MLFNWRFFSLNVCYRFHRPIAKNTSNYSNCILWMSWECCFCTFMSFWPAHNKTVSCKKRAEAERFLPILHKANVLNGIKLFSQSSDSICSDNGARRARNVFCITFEGSFCGATAKKKLYIVIATKWTTVVKPYNVE